MPAAPEDRPSEVPWPPVIYAGVLAVAWGLERWLPLPALAENLLIRWLGAVIFLGGLGLGFKGLLALREAGTTFDPTRPADALATRGIFARSRNPLYLAALIAFLGLGLALRSSWLLVSVPLIAVALTKLAIEPEEAYLERRFGRRYLDYKARVRRWL